MDAGARAREILEEILQRMGLVVRVEVVEGGERSTLDVHGADSALVIGKKGATLEALQYLVLKMVYRGAEGGQRPIQIDSEGYRLRREESLVDMARRLAEKAVRTQRIVTVSPMSPQDRRVIHVALGEVPGVTTRSEGEGVYRRLMIVPDAKKTGGGGAAGGGPAAGAAGP